MSRNSEVSIARPELTSIEAQLFITDMKSSSDFYIEKLGFKINFVYGEPAFYCQVMRAAHGFICEWSGNQCSPTIFTSASICYPPSLR